MIEKISSEIKLFLTEIEKLGFSLCLVGGFTRDYFYDGSIGNDLDFEIRSFESLSIMEWPIYYKKLHRFLDEKQLSYDEFPYLITRVHFSGKDFEFSSPRTEVKIPENFTHHHFKATLDPNLTYKLSFKRRDISINAIGIKLDGQIIDPYNGLDDLKRGFLNNISEDFFSDSVRFLRLIRFKLKFNSFIIDESLLSKLKLFNLSQLSAYHFNKELFKSTPGAFLNLFSQFVISIKLDISEELKVLTKYIFPNELLTKEEILAYVFLVNEDDAKKVSAIFSLPEKKLKDLKSYCQSYNTASSFKVEDLQVLLARPQEEVLEHWFLKDLKNLEEKKEWHSIVKRNSEKKDLLIHWSDWEKVSVSEAEINSLSPALRSYYLYYKTLKKIFANG